ncbi:MAG: hypothetical protein AAGG81_06255 [Chlamydiota bacterium]
MKQFYCEYEFLIPQLSKVLESLKADINNEYFKIVVDEALVNEVVKQLLENESKEGQTS